MMSAPGTSYIWEFSNDPLDPSIYSTLILPAALPVQLQSLISLWKGQPTCEAKMIVFWMAYTEGYLLFVDEEPMAYSDLHSV